MSCVYHLRTVRFGTWFTPLLEGSFIAGCKETRTELHLAENRWLPPHRVLFYFPKILVPNLTTKLSGSCQKLQTVQPGHCSRDCSCPVVWCSSSFISGKPRSGNQVLGLGSGCSCLGSNCWRKRGSSQWICYIHMLQTLQVESVVLASTEILNPMSR